MTIMRSIRIIHVQNSAGYKESVSSRTIKIPCQRNRSAVGTLIVQVCNRNIRPGRAMLSCHYLTHKNMFTFLSLDLLCYLFMCVPLINVNYQCITEKKCSIQICMMTMMRMSLLLLLLLLLLQFIIIIIIIIIII